MVFLSFTVMPLIVCSVPILDLRNWVFDASAIHRLGTDPSIPKWQNNQTEIPGGHVVVVGYQASAYNESSGEQRFNAGLHWVGVLGVATP